MPARRVERPTVFVMEAQSKAALPAIELLAQGGLRVAAGSEKRRNSGFYSRGCRERHVYPSPRDCKAEFQRWLLAFLQRRDIEMLFPIGHYGAAAVSEIQDVVRRHTRLLMPDHAAFRAAYAKISTMKTALAAGVPIPDSWFPGDHSGGIEAVLPRIPRWPVLIKPSVGVGARGIVRCHHADELRARFPEAVAAFGECYVQDWVPSGGMQYKVDMLVDASRRCLAGIVYGKTRMYPPDGGSSVLNFSAERPDILDCARRMLVRLDWVGFCDFDFVDDPRDGRAKLMEINPRYPESFRMGPSVGINFPMMMYRMAHGESVEPVNHYPQGYFLRFLPGDLLWFLRADHARRSGTWPGWFRFFDRRTAYQLCRLNDWGPMLGYLLENLSMLSDARLRGERIRLPSGAQREQPVPQKVSG